MLVLLAESKTMASSQVEVTESEYNSHKPLFENLADEIMANLESFPPADISQIMGISNALAVKAHSLAYEFPHKSTGYKALFGYTGEAFKALDAETLSEQAVETAFSKLKFISSIYGFLNSSDIIKPYRSEFNKPFAPNHKTPIDIFKSKVTIAIVNHIKENKISDIINLLPGDAEKLIDWKIVRAFAKVHKICFQTMTPDGCLKTPIAKRLKELRGLMTREILINNLSDFDAITKFESSDFIFSPTDSKPLLPVFISD